MIIEMPAESVVLNFDSYLVKVHYCADDLSKVVKIEACEIFEQTVPFVVDHTDLAKVLLQIKSGTKPFGIKNEITQHSHHKTH
jgi:hypothetical protein